MREFRGRHEAGPHVREGRQRIADFFENRSVGLGSRLLKSPCPAEGDLRETVGILVLVGVGELAADNPDGVLATSLADEHDDHLRT